MSGFQLAGSVALVTGGSRGIGAAIVRALAREGCDIAFLHVGDEEAAGRVAKEVESLGRRVHVAESDVGDPEATDRFWETAEAALGPISVLVCNAGITRDGVLWKMTGEQWDEVVRVNLSGVFHHTRAAARRFRARGKEGSGGRIVHITSINGLRGKFGQSNYAATKGGIIALAKSAARELGRFSVTVNAVAPGMVLTDMAAELPADILARARAETVLGRLAAPEDIADVVAFLCHERARHVTGQCLQVDGGQYI